MPLSSRAIPYFLLKQKQSCKHFLSAAGNHIYHFVSKWHWRDTVRGRAITSCFYLLILPARQWGHPATYPEHAVLWRLLSLGLAQWYLTTFLAGTLNSQASHCPGQQALSQFSFHIPTTSLNLPGHQRGASYLLVLAMVSGPTAFTQRLMLPACLVTGQP